MSVMLRSSWMVACVASEISGDAVTSSSLRSLNRCCDAAGVLGLKVSWTRSRVTSRNIPLCRLAPAVKRDHEPKHTTRERGSGSLVYTEY